MKGLVIFSILVLMSGIAPVFAEESEPVYEVKCGQDAIDVGALCIMEEKEPTESIKLLSLIGGNEN